MRILFISIMAVATCLLACQHQGGGNSRIKSVEAGVNEVQCSKKLNDALTIEVNIRPYELGRIAYVAAISPISATEPTKIPNVFLTEDTQFLNYSAPNFKLRIAKLSASLPPAYHGELTTVAANNNQLVVVDCDKITVPSSGLLAYDDFLSEAQQFPYWHGDKCTFSADIAYTHVRLQIASDEPGVLNGIRRLFGVW